MVQVASSFQQSKIGATVVQLSVRRLPSLGQSVRNPDHWPRGQWIGFHGLKAVTLSAIFGERANKASRTITGITLALPQGNQAIFVA